MNDEEQRVYDLVCEAFRDVKLGGGIGLLQGQGIDDHAGPLTLQAYRANDEKDKWSAISLETLSRCQSSLSFFDAEGMRFHLPAYICASLRRAPGAADIVFYLVTFKYRGTSRYDLLTLEQRDAVRQFLLLDLSNPLRAPIHETIRDALRDYWT